MTTIITGKDLTLVIDAVSFNAQGSQVTLELVNEQSEFDTLSGTAYKTLKKTGTLNVTLFQDWGAVSSVCEALWTAANTAPDTPLEFTFTANGASFTGEVFPNFGTVGGESPSELTTSISMVVVGGEVTVA